MLLILCLLGQIQFQNDVRHNELSYISGKATQIVFRYGDSDPTPYLLDYVAGKPIQFTPTQSRTAQVIPTKDGGVFLHQKSFSGPAGWTCTSDYGTLNRPRIFGSYWDGDLYVWGVNFRDTYGKPPRVFLVNSTVTELPIIPFTGDAQQAQEYYEGSYLVRLRPTAPGQIVLYTECGPHGLTNTTISLPTSRSVLYLKDFPTFDDLKKSAISLKANMALSESGDIVLPDGVGLVGCRVKGKVVMGVGSELIDCTIDGTVQLSSNCNIRKCRITSENICIYTVGSISDSYITDTDLKGLRGFQIQYGASKTYKRVCTIRCTFEGLRYANTVSGFILGESCAVVDCKVKNSYRGMFGQSNSGPVRWNLIDRNDFTDGGFNQNGGEQILLEHQVGVKFIPLEYTSTSFTYPGSFLGKVLYVESGTGRGQYGVIIGQEGNKWGLDRAVYLGADSTVSVGPYGVENLFILNRVVRSRTGLMFWVGTIGNIVSGHQSYDVQVGFNQCGDLNHAMAAHNVVRDSFFHNSAMIFSGKEDGHLGFRLCRTNSNGPIRVDGIGDVFIVNKSNFYLFDPIPIGIAPNGDYPAQKMPFPPIQPGRISSWFFQDSTRDGLRKDKLEDYIN